jgi:hypothetical protein
MTGKIGIYLNNCYVIDNIGIAFLHIRLSPIGFTALVLS